jgi:hypothetical protein
LSEIGLVQLVWVLMRLVRQSRVLMLLKWQSSVREVSNQELGTKLCAKFRGYWRLEATL